MQDGIAIWRDEATATRSTGARVRTELNDRGRAIDALVQGRQVVYAFRLADGTIKIGCTSNLRARRNHYVGSDILGFMFGDYEDEQAIHVELVQHRARGHEYYHPTPEVLAVVNDMRDTFGLHRLGL